MLKGAGGGEIIRSSEKIELENTDNFVHAIDKLQIITGKREGNIATLMEEVGYSLPASDMLRDMQTDEYSYMVAKSALEVFHALPGGKFSDMMLNTAADAMSQATSGYAVSLLLARESGTEIGGSITGLERDGPYHIRISREHAADVMEVELKIDASGVVQNGKLLKMKRRTEPGQTHFRTVESEILFDNEGRATRVKNSNVEEGEVLNTPHFISMLSDSSTLNEDQNL